MADTTKKYFTDESLEALVSNVKSYADQAASSAVADKAPASHTHDDRYYTESEIDTKFSTVNTSITNITNGSTPVEEAKHAESADEATHAETATSATTADTANAVAWGSVTGKPSTFTPSTHNHDDRYYTESEIDTKLSGKSDSTHNHDTKYDALGAAADAEEAANAYTDQKTANLISTSAVDTKISTHNTSTAAHSDIRDLISALSTKVNNFLDVDDTTTDQLSEVLAMIEANEGTIESLTSNKVNVSDIVDNLTTNNASKVLSAKQGLVLKGLIDALQTAVDGKADDGHKHAISDVTDLQTTLNAKATQSSLDSHTGNTTVHITATERTNWNAAKTHADSAHAPSNAEKNQNAFSNVAVSGQTTVAADTATDTLTLVAGDNVTITTNATNDSVTISAKDTVVTVDTALSSTSTNPVQNKVVNSAVTTLTSAVGANTDSISSHSTAISNLQTSVNSFEEITSAEITALFNA